MLRTLIIAALINVGATAAWAQSEGTGTNAPDSETGSKAAPGVLDDPAKMKPFYTDESMMTLRSPSELATSFQAMNTEDREAVAKECQNVNTQRESFCKAFNDANKN